VRIDLDPQAVLVLVARVYRKALELEGELHPMLSERYPQKLAAADMRGRFLPSPDTTSAARTSTSF